MVIGHRSQRAIRGLDVESPHVCPWRLKGLLLAATANGQSNVPFRLLLLTKAAPNYRHCGLVAPAHFSKGLKTREKRLKLDEASVAVGRARGERRAMCRLMPLHGSLHRDRPSCQKRTKRVDHCSTCPSEANLAALGEMSVHPSPPVLFPTLILPPPSSSPPPPLSWRPFPLTTK